MLTELSAHTHRQYQDKAYQDADEKMNQLLRAKDLLRKKLQHKLERRNSGLELSSQKLYRKD